MPRELKAALDGLEFQWRAAGAPIVGHLRPPATPADLQQVQAVLPVTLPEDARTFWAWHNGASGPPVPSSAVGCCQFHLLSTAQAASDYTTRRGLARDIGQQNDISQDEFWEPHWLPIASWGRGEAHLTMDCRTGEIRDVRWLDGDHRRVLADRLAEVVDLWSWLLRDGTWRWDADPAGWTRTRQSHAELDYRYAGLT